MAKLTMSIVLKKHIRNNELVFAICDSDLKGKSFEEGNLSLNLDCNFYDGSLSDIEDIKKAILDSKSGVAVGESSVSLVKDLFPDIEIRFVNNVPFVNIFKF